jgi:hypothetical protein
MALTSVWRNRLGGIPIYENSLMTETESYTVEVQKSFKERWINPIQYPVTTPFEPWVKTRIEERVRQIPSRRVLQTAQGLIMHPAMARELRKKMQEMS